MIRYLISIFAVLLLGTPAESAQITVSRMGGDTLVRAQRQNIGVSSKFTSAIPLT
jgi:hypothetical protein